MDAFFQWLSSNPTVTITLQVALTGLVLAVALIYVVAFIQGREVSFWPPKIGIKPEKKRPSEKTDGSVEVRLLVREPAFSFALSDPKSSAGVFTAGLRVYGHSSSTRPFWVLRPSDRWFHFFVESCEKLWNASQPWELDHE